MDRIALDCVSTGSSEKRKRCRTSGAALARALRRLRSGAWPIRPVLRRFAPAGLCTAAARPASRCDVPGGLAVTGGGSGSSLEGRAPGARTSRRGLGGRPSGPVIFRCSLDRAEAGSCGRVSGPWSRRPAGNLGPRHWRPLRRLCINACGAGCPEKAPLAAPLCCRGRVNSRQIKHLQHERGEPHYTGQSRGQPTN